MGRGRALIAVSETNPNPEQMALPFAAREYVDTRRACRILGVGYRTLQRFVSNGQIEWVSLGKVSWKRVRYKSVVDFCDRIRQQHKIASRRPPLHPHLRHRDEDLLPFPLRDTMSSEEALAVLGLSNGNKGLRFAQMVEEGRFEAYQLIPQGPWRVSRSSLLAYMERARSPKGSTGPMYKVPAATIHF